MPTIRILPPEVANQIAAGEVVERPASVVRELLDNAIDAGADRIAVEVEDGGLSLIRVTDSGCGMSAEDAALCTHRHATSKIQTAEDLHYIVTKGFRGEALSSIAAVSNLKLITRRAEDEHATLVQINGGVQETFGPAAAPPGTTVIVSDLFFNTPARKKFLKKPSTEMGHICTTVTWLALAHEQIHLTLTHNRRMVLELPGVSDRVERIKTLYGRDIMRELLPLCTDTPQVSVTGFISRPTTTRNGTQHMFTFVNSRLVRHKMLQRALMDGYRNILPAARYPVVFLYIEVDPHTIDINVHPTKQEVRFAHEDAVFSAVYGAVRQAWEERFEPSTSAPLEPPTPPSPVTETGAGPLPESARSPAPRPAKPSVRPTGLRDTSRATRRLLAPGDSPDSSSPAIQSAKADKQPPPEAIPEQPPRLREPSVEPAMQDATGAEVEIRADLLAVSSVDKAPDLIVRGQLADGYVLAEGEKGLYIIDQHAAHERILFERFLAASKRGPLPSQKLLFPATIDLSPAEIETLSASLQELENLGFELEEFGPSTYAVRAIPANLNTDSAADLLRDVIAEIQGEGSMDARLERALHTVACRAAVKVGQPLDQQAMQNLVESLRTVSRRDFCPHGRPSVVFLSKESVRKAFKRG